MGHIDPKDITVVVQGPVVEKEHMTECCIQSIRRHLPGATIVLSTWHGQNTSGIPCDIVVENEDPGYIETLLPQIDPKEIRLDSCDRQIVSSLAGVQKAKTPYVARLRSDLKMTGTGFVGAFEAAQALPRDEDYTILDTRVITLTTCNPRRRSNFPFTVADWFFFGEKSDIENIFDIPRLDTKKLDRATVGGRTVVVAKYSTEQYIWTSFLSKHARIELRDVTDDSLKNLEDSERYFSNNCFFLTARHAGIDWLKHPGAAYAQNPIFSNSGLYTENEFKRLLNRYANCNLHIRKNVLEDMVYAMVYSTRHRVKSMSPTIHDFIARIVNPRNH